MARTMTDSEALSLLPVINEFMQLVDERDQAGVQAALAYTPPAALAVLTAERANQLRSQRDTAAKAFAASVREWKARLRKATEQAERDASKIKSLERDRALQADRIAHLKEQLHAAGVKTN